ncbi:TRAP transporter small permease [Nitratireductor sp. OM-1]|uniref:TRAP transporter small permease n=1 Tax=Nitratireductor sp. OM-1 TaxID=1756988 RepID=UPI0013AFB3F2|nr:TRAP transporter small permease [Nitratireductor sp. OM-1]
MLPRIYRLLGSAENSAAILLISALALVVFLQFFTRYVLNASFGWTEEVARYLMIATSFLGAAISVRHGTQLRIELFEKWFGRNAANWAERYVILPVNIATFFWITFYGWELASRTRRSMTMVDLPLTTLYWPVVGFFALMVLHSVVHVFTGTPRPDFSAEEGASR